MPQITTRQATRQATRQETTQMMQILREIQNRLTNIETARLTNIEAVMGGTNVRLNNIETAMNAMEGAINNIKETVHYQELRSATRTKNSTLRGQGNIEPLYFSSERLPMNYPDTRDQFDALTGNEIRQLLDAYDIKIRDDESEDDQKNKLATFLGVF